MAEIRDISEQELQAILDYLEDKPEGDNPTVLVGGWAVYSYNKYEKSRDIDLVLNSKRRGRLMYWLREERDYTEYKKHKHGWMGAEKRFPDLEGAEKSMVVDVAGYNEAQRFEGREERLDFDLVRDHHVVREAAGCEVCMPTRSLLILYKAKAAYDRNARLQAGTSSDPDWELDKLIKDRSDILALLDSGVDGPDWEVGFLGSELERLLFLKDVLMEAAGDERAVNRYRDGRLSGAEAQKRMDEFLSLVT